MSAIADLRRLVPGNELKPGDPRLTTIAVRPLDPPYDHDRGDHGDRYAVLAVEAGVQYVVWTLVVEPDGPPEGQTVNGTYLRLGDRVFAEEAERLFLRAFADWLGRT